MITREQALQLQYRDELHYGTCKKIMGTRGGIRYAVERWRVNGKVKTWKRQPDNFEVPIKYGLRDYHYLHNLNAYNFHLATDCPVFEQKALHTAPDDEELYKDRAEAIQQDRAEDDRP